MTGRHDGTLQGRQSGTCRGLTTSGGAEPKPASVTRSGASTGEVTHVSLETIVIVVVIVLIVLFVLGFIGRGRMRR
jgi:hypothetical protein